MKGFDYLKSNPEFKLIEVKGGTPKIEAYGKVWPFTTQLNIELAAYRCNLNGEGWKHMRNASFILWPEHKATWHEWTEKRFKTFCDGCEVMTWAGGAACGKSYDAAKLAILFWLANPTERAVLVASTTLAGLETRVFGYVKRFYLTESAMTLPGKLYSAGAPKILLDRVDGQHGIFAVPLIQGNSDKAISGLIGRHVKDGLFVCIDEATDCNPAFVDSIPNLRRGVENFRLIAIGNSNSAYDAHGLLSEPLAGWAEADYDNLEEWPTKWGKCLYFDAYRSPAITDPDEEKRKALGKFLFTESSIEEAKERYGENSPAFWRFVRGAWPNNDVSNTVLNPVMCSKFKVTETPVEWEGIGSTYTLMGVDPAFNESGDACVARIATLGLATSGKMVLDFHGKNGIHYLKINDSSSMPAEYQIIDQLKDLCAKYKIPPRNVAIDTWGAGSGLGAIIEQEWSREVYQVVSAGRPTDMQVSSQSEDRACDVYDRKVSELWFAIRQLVQTEQIKGLDPVSVEQFCTRTYEIKGRKYSVESKADFKLRLGKVDTGRWKSPDEADAVAFVVDLARRYFNFISTPKATEITKESILTRKFLQERLAERRYYAQFNQEYEIASSPSGWDDGFLNDYEF